VLDDVAYGLRSVSILCGFVNTTNVLGRCRLLWPEKWWIAIGRTMSYRNLIAGAPAFGRIALIHPARNALVKDPQIAIPFGVQLFVGQTGQLVWARSIEND